MTITVIDPTGDLTVEVIEYDTKARGGESNKPVINKAQFRVKRSVLSENSPVFKVMLLPPRWQERTQKHLELHEDKVSCMQVIFQVLHKVGPSFDLELPDIWYLVAAIDKYDLGIQFMETWFAKWYEITGQPNDEDEAKLLYPTWRFNHAEGFAHITESLTYGEFGHIMEVNPVRHELPHLHLPPRIIRTSIFTCSAPYN